MSQLIAPSHTSTGSIPLGRRISEIMNENGSSYSLNAMGQRLGISRETIRLMLVGEREIFWYELEKIAKDLKLSIDRILQNDILEECRLLDELLEKKDDLPRALMVADHLKHRAIGITERCQCLFTIARIWYDLRMYEEAHLSLLEAYEIAHEIARKFDDVEILFNIISKLMVTFTIKKDYSKLSDIIEKVEKYFDSSPIKQGAICYSKAMIEEHFGNHSAVREYLTESLRNYKLTGNMIDIGRAELNLGYFEFKNKNYFESKCLLESAIVKLDGDHYKQIATKEYAKTLIKLGEMVKADKVLRNELGSIRHPDLQAKYMLLLAISNDDIPYAESIISLPNVGKTVLRLVCKFLTKHYIELRDSEALMKYSIIAEGLSISQSDVIHEEDL